MGRENYVKLKLLFSCTTNLSYYFIFRGNDDDFLFDDIVSA